MASKKGGQANPLQRRQGKAVRRAQGAALGAAGVRQDADVNAALSGQRAHTLAGVGQAILGGSAAASAGYLIYRGIRMLPALLPAFWWTIPAKLVAP